MKTVKWSSCEIDVALMLKEILFVTSFCGILLLLVSLKDNKHYSA